MNQSTSHLKNIGQPALYLRLFGAPEIRLHNRSINTLPAKAHALLAYLAITRQGQLRTTMANLLWGEMSERKALANLRKILQKLRKALPNCFSEDRKMAALHPHVLVCVDVLAFENQIKQAISRGDAVALDAAIKLYENDFLAGFYIRKAPEFEAWQLAQQARLREIMIDAMKTLSHLLIAQGDLNRAIDITRYLLEHEPWREDEHRKLMGLLAQNDEHNLALIHYEMCRQTLKQELGVSPSDATKQLYKQIRSGQFEQIQHDPNALLNVHATTTPSALGFKIPHRLDLRFDLRSDKQLFGVDVAHAALKLCLQSRERPWLISIDGIGGVGKTVLAQELVNDLSKSSYFERMAWISAKQEEFQPNHGIAATGYSTTSYSAMDAEQLVDSLLAQLAQTEQPAAASAAEENHAQKEQAEKERLLQHILAEKPTLIVVDNLETVADYEALLPTLRTLANPSKFVITSRYSLAHNADVFTQTLGELTRENVFELLRHEATKRGIRGLADADDDTLAQIYAVTGGHPLSLMLVLGQLRFLPLKHVLDNLRHATGPRVDELYTYIYWQTWQMLDQTSRQLFCVMPLLHHANYAQLVAITQLPEDALQPALAQLIGLSLIHVDGDLFEPRYSLHRLTETFLTNHIQRVPANQVPANQVLSNQKWLQPSPFKQDKTLLVSSFLDVETEWFDFYQQTVLNGLSYWNAEGIVQEIDVSQLERERESILNLINYGLAFDRAWPRIRTLIVALASYMERRGHWRSWRTLLERAILAARRIADVDGETTITALMGRLAQRQGRWEEVENCYRRVLHLADQSGNLNEKGRACSNLGYYYIDAGYWWRSEVLCLHALKVFRELKSDHGQAHTHNHLGMLYIRQKEWERAKENLENACRIWKNSDDQHSLLHGYLNLGMMYAEMGQTPKALDNLQNAHRIAQQTGELSHVARIWNNMAVAYHNNADWREAERCAKKAEALFREYADERGLASVWQNLGLIYSGTDQRKLAVGYLDDALAVHRKLNNQRDTEDILAKMSAL